MTIKAKIFSAALAIVLIVGIATFIGNREADQNSAGFKVGLISILSGDYAAVGEAFKNGAVLAQEEYNAAHPAAPVELYIEDDGFSGGRGVSAYQKLVGLDKVDALINVSTPTIDSIYETVSKTDMPVIQGGEQGREPSDDNVFGIYPSSIESEYDYGVYMREQGIREMALVYTNIDAMVRFVDAFKEGFQGKTTDFIIKADEKDLRPHALKVAASGYETVGTFIVPQQGAQFLKEYLKVAPKKPKFFFDTNFQSGFTDYERILGDLTILDGSIVGSMNIPTTDQFRASYKARFGSDAGFLADIGYDAFNVLARTHDVDPKKWQENIKKLSMVGASGVTKFSEKGNRKPDTKMMVMKGGKISEI
ncbi:MAG TPA: ABC transporter substrate-binding protein [Candidatus Paceibacterota bacterium]